MGVTLQEIADHLHVSKATVSRSLRNDPLILPRTRAKVHATALRLGYEGRPRATRRKSETGDSGAQNAAPLQGTLGLLFPARNLERARQDSNLVQIMHGAMIEAERIGMMVVVQTIQPGTQESMEQNPALVPPAVRQKACRALMVWGALQPEDVAFLAAQLPVVTIGRIYREAPVDSVMHDNVPGACTIVSHLAKLGHRRLAWVGAYYTATFLDERQAGFVTGCLQNGLDLRQQHFFCEESYENRHLKVEDTLLKAISEGTTAVVCANDSIAREVITSLESTGLRVPEDVSVTGFDSHHVQGSSQHITSFDPRFTELGRVAVRLAAQRLTQAPTAPCVVTVRGEYTPGNTIAAARDTV